MDTCVICLELINVKPSYKLHFQHEFHTERQSIKLSGGNDGTHPTPRDFFFM